MPCIPRSIRTILVVACFGQSAPAASPRGSPCEDPYWHDHGAIVIQSNWSVEGTLDSIRVLSNHAAGVDVDSLVAVVRRWEPPKAVTRCVTWALAFERTRGSAEYPEAALPRPAGAALDHGALRDWAAMMQRFDADFGAADFVLQSSRPMQRLEGWHLSPERLKEELTSGLVLRSPGGRWALDLSMGAGVGPSGEVEYDVDLGYAVFDAQTGAQADYYVSTLTWFEAAAWLDENTFVIADTGEIGSGCGCGPVRAPVIDIGDMKLRQVSSYLGAPILPAVIHEMQHEGAALREHAFPILEASPGGKPRR